jgi:hypothetical protein
MQDITKVLQCPACGDAAHVLGEPHGQEAGGAEGGHVVQHPLLVAGAVAQEVRVRVHHAGLARVLLNKRVLLNLNNEGAASWVACKMWIISLCAALLPRFSNCILSPDE